MSHLFFHNTPRHFTHVYSFGMCMAAAMSTAALGGRVWRSTKNFALPTTVFFAWSYLSPIIRKSSSVWFDLMYADK